MVNRKERTGVTRREFDDMRIAAVVLIGIVLNVIFWGGLIMLVMWGLEEMTNVGGLKVVIDQLWCGSAGCDQ